MSVVFVDSNVLLRHLLYDHPDQSDRATEALRTIERGELRGYLTVTVVFETVFTLERSYGRSKTQIADALMSLLDMPGLTVPDAHVIRRAFDLYADLNLPFADAYHAAAAWQAGIEQVLSFDRHFDRIPGIERVEP